MTSHTDLVGMSDQQLLAIAPDATHQHYKGGLYKFLGRAMDADTGEPWLRHEEFVVAYEHVYPHERQVWIRHEVEFESLVQVGEDWVPRFRKLCR